MREILNLEKYIQEDGGDSDRQLRYSFFVIQLRALTLFSDLSVSFCVHLSIGIKYEGA